MTKTHHGISHVKNANASQACTINHFKYIKIILYNKYSCDVSCVDFINLCQRHTTGCHTQKFIVSRNIPCKFQNPSWIANFTKSLPFYPPSMCRHSDIMCGVREGEGTEETREVTERIE
jgi:hypothetical protein